MSTKRNTVLAVVLCAAAGVAIGTLARRTAAAVEAVETGEATEAYRPADAATARVIGERATEYWKARTRLDLHGAYPFYEAGFRARYAREAFVKTFQRLNRFSPELVRVDRIEVDMSGTCAKVSMTLRSKPPVLEGQELVSTTEDVWILKDGVWWRQAEPLMPVV